MALPKFYKVCQDQNGNIVPQVLGSVFNHGTAVLASLYQDDAGTLPLSNPMTSDAQYGSFKFYVNPGHYDLTFTKPGYTFEPIYDMQVPQDVLTLGTMAQQNANAVAITGGNLSGVGLTAAPTIQGGFLGINRATIGDIRAALTYTKSSEYGMLFTNGLGDTGRQTILFQNAAAAVVGSIDATASATAFNTSSDGRLKEAIAALPHALETIQRLLPVEFRWKATGEVGHGFVAQDVLPVVPQAVTGDPADPEPNMQMDHSKLIPWVVAGLQEVVQRLEALEVRLAAREGTAEHA